MIISETCYARAGVVGNPSDLFNGKTIALLFDRFKALVKLYETPRLRILPNLRDVADFESLDELVRYRRQFGYYGGIRLIEATIVRFRDDCARRGIALAPRNFTIEYHSTIPFSLGLGGSSAIAKAVLAALMRFFDVGEDRIPKPELPNIILEAETQELMISAGPQDRVVAVYGGMVCMDFTPQAYERNGGLHGDYQPLDPSLLPPLFIAYREDLAKSSGAIHNIMRYRAAVEHDTKVLEAMRKKALLVDEARERLLAGDTQALGPIMTRDFDLRRSVYTIAPADQKMIDIARSLGAHAKQTGSGGAAIGVYRDEDQYVKLEEAYHRNGFSTVKVRVVQ